MGDRQCRLAMTEELEIAERGAAASAGAVARVPRRAAAHGCSRCP